jgi:hypothetical protein
MQQDVLAEEASWPRADLFFMKDALDRGMSCAEVAGFLGRTEEEVREQSGQASKRRAPRLCAGQGRSGKKHRAARAKIARG